MSGSESRSAAPDSRVFWAGLLGLSLVGLLWRALGLPSQPPTGDDGLVAISAWSYLETGHLGPTMWNHPPLRNLLVWASMSLGGTGALGVKGASLLLGALAVPLLGGLTRRLTGSAAAGLLAAGLLAVDSLHTDFSRQSVQEVYMATFTLAALWVALGGRAGGGPWQRVLAGALFGLGVASKWYVVLPLVVLMYFVGAEAWRREERDAPLLAALRTSFELGGPAVAVYVLTFLPWALRGYGFGDFIDLQLLMLSESATHAGYNEYGFEVPHRAWLWFLRPTAFADFVIADGRPTVLLALTNPLVWLPTLPCVALLTSRAWQDRTSPRWLLVLLFWVTYLPLVLTSRPIWLHTALAVLPFALAGIAVVVVEAAGSGRGRVVLGAWLVIVVLVSWPLRQLAVGEGLESSLLRPIVESYRPSNERPR